MMIGVVKVDKVIPIFLVYCSLLVSLLNITISDNSFFQFVLLQAYPSVMLIYYFFS